MSEQEKAPQEAEEVIPPDEQPTEGVKPEDDSEQLKAQLEIERKAREKAEKAAAENAYKFRQAKNKKEEDEEEDEENRPLTRREFLELQSRERDYILRETQATKINEIASNLCENETERELLIERFKNRSFPEHLSLEEKLEECYAGMYSKKLRAERDEALRALKNKGNVSSDHSSGHHDSPEPGQPQMNPADSAELARLGFKWNGSHNRFEKKLANGRTLVHDSKTKQNRVI